MTGKTRISAGSGMARRGVYAVLLAGVLAGLIGLCGAVTPAHADFVDAMNAVKPERQHRLLRRAAWTEHDVMAQAELCRRYSDGKGSSADPIEAYVWCYMASVNLRLLGTSKDAIERFKSDVYATAYQKRSQMFDRLSTPDRAEAFNRITYIFACRGPSGFARLGELYDPSVKRVGLAATDREPEFDLLKIFREAERAPVVRKAAGDLARNPLEAMTFYYLAELAGHPYATDLRQKLEFYLLRTRDLPNSQVTSMGQLAHERAKAWIPPFEVYANGIAGPLGRYTDECPVNGRWELALHRIEDLRPRNIQFALKALRFYTGPIDDDIGGYTLSAIEDFQGANFWYPSGRLRPYELVMLIRLAALSGDEHSQTTLGYMYACGVGVPADEYRAVRWYEEAYRQRSALAAYNLGVLLNPSDKSKKCAPKADYRKVPDDQPKSNAYYEDAARWGIGHLSDAVLQRLDNPTLHHHHQH